MATHLLSASEELFSALPEDPIYLAVHDASRLGWNVAVAAPQDGRASYEIVVELEMPTDLLGAVDLWSTLQTYARLDAAEPKESTTTEGFRRAVVAVAVNLARARDGFVRHTTLLRSSAVSDEETEARALVEWINIARATLAHARVMLLPKGRAPEISDDERRMAEEFLSGQLWTVLTDCTRALIELADALEHRADHDPEVLDIVEKALAAALKEEIRHRRRARLPHGDPKNALELEDLVSRLRALKRHFERVLALEFESYEVVTRVSGWVSAVTAMLAYLWFLFWQLTLERGRIGSIGSGVVLVALVTAIVYASRERVRDAARSWVAGRVQRMYAQRVTRYRLPGRRPPVIVARESFSRSTAERSDPADPMEAIHEVSLIRFSHRGSAFPAEVLEGWGEAHVRLFFRLDLSGIFPRLQDAVRGFASPDPRTGRLTIVDVARNYEIGLRARLRSEAGTEEIRRTLVLNKNGLVRLDDAPADRA